MIGRGYRHAFDAGRAQVRQLNADRERMQFIRLCARHSYHAALMMTELENDFVTRMLLEHGAESVPKVFCGDANIIDSLRRKYEARLNLPIKPIACAARTLP